MSSRTIKILLVLALAVCALGMEAQMLPNPYGPPITVENAKKAAAAALAEAVKNHWVMAVAIVDPNGTLVYYEKTDNTQLGSANVSINKARSAALYKRSIGQLSSNSRSMRASKVSRSYSSSPIRTAFWPEPSFPNRVSIRARPCKSDIPGFTLLPVLRVAA